MVKLIHQSASGSARSRVVLLHAHLFKNAGSTFDWSLRRSFGDAFTDHRDDDAMRRGAQYLGPYIQERPQLRALSSHWLTFPLPQLADVDIQLAMFFRDPIERVRSVYNFERQQQGVDSPGVRQARALGFVDYVRWRLQDGVGPVINNYHTRYCSGVYMGGDLEQKYDLAVATIESTPLLGLVHRYEESVILFEYHLQSLFPDLDLSWRIQNSNEEQAVTGTEKRRTTERDLDAIMEELVAANRYDLRLYALVEARFDKALGEIGDVVLRLQDLRARNEMLL
jgi:hypothetical protein